MKAKNKDRKRLAESGIAVDHLNPAKIREQWTAATNTPPPRYVSRSLLMRMLADRLQVAKHGGLSPETKRRLLKIATAVRNGEPVASQPTPSLRPGTMLVRDWQGSRHQVVVREGGFAFEGEIYHSLSEVARKITGTRWSGPAFFGLKSKRPTQCARGGAS